ncbi:unnamed protein product [Pneumocystis jirovecii]|uniref:Uncharacterized protein n=1 Tax=Pneumocystis jirovecii TaxID=42068 RepID=L0PFI3_PNEJI|nr:unnamed protein product [Pneumocystis jirovecii]
MNQTAFKKDIKVDFSLKIRREIEILGVKYWRCGLVAVGKKNVFVAVDDVIRVYEKSQSHGLDENSFFQLKCQIDSHTVIRGEIDAITPLSFNSIKVGYIGNEEVLVCCTDSGYINVWFTDDLLRSPLIFNTERSVWGIAIHASKRLLAISSNAHVILWDTDKGGWPHKFFGHDDNIPSVCFNHSGTLLSSVGIDATCRLWDVASGTLLHVYLDSQRGWFVGFINHLAFKVVKRTDSSEKRLKSTPSQVMMTCVRENRINDRDVLYSAENVSNYENEREETTNDINTNSHQDIQRTFLNGHSAQTLFWRNYSNRLDGSNFPSSIEYLQDDSFFSFYTSTEYNELLFYGTEKNIKLCSIEETVSGIQLLTECKNLFDENDTNQTRSTFIPDLSLCVVASQKGKACLVYLVKSVMDCDDGSVLLSYTMVADQMFPEDPPSCGLLGMTVEKIHSKHYKLYMLYYDGTLILYDIKKPVFNMIDVDELML